MTEYDKLLLHPKWEAKRKAILKRDEYRCTSCGAKKNLQVHHIFYYDTFPAPWNYPNYALITLCSTCHKAIHDKGKIEIRHLAKKKKKKVRVIPYDGRDDYRSQKGKKQRAPKHIKGRKKYYSLADRQKEYGTIIRPKHS